MEGLMPRHDAQEVYRGQRGEVHEPRRPTDAARAVAPRRGADQAARLAALLAARAAPFDAPFHAGAADAAVAPHA